MPYRQKGSPYWYICYTASDGGRVRESSGTANHAEAKALESTRRAESWRARKWGVAPVITYDELMERYLTSTVSKKSHSRDLFSAVPLTKHFTGKAIAEITPQDVADYKSLRGRSVSNSTIAKELLLISAAVRYARNEWGWDLPNPVSGRVPKIRADAPRWLTRKEAGKLIKEARRSRGAARKEGPLVLDFIELGLSTGMRAGEMLGLEWRRVDLAKRLIYLGAADQKSGRPGSIPVNSWAAAILLRRQAFRGKYCPRSRWVFCDSSGGRTGSLKKAFAGAVERARLGAGVSPHTLRHTAAAWLVQADVPLRTVSELLRHKDIRTTMRYAHLAPENARKASDALDALRVDPAPVRKRGI